MTTRILIVDDDADALGLIGLTLRRRGYDVITAPGGPEALDILERELPDLVLLDVMMPVMDGYEVCRRLRQDARTSDLAVIMLTAKAQVASRLEGLKIGADDYVTKPVHPDELVAHITNVLANRRTSVAGDSTTGTGKTGKLIGCLGCKGGAGATTVAVNIALVLASRGKVVLADFSGDATVYFGQSPFDQPTSLSKLDSDQIDQAAIEHAWMPHSSGVTLLYDAELLDNTARLETVFKQVASLVDFCVLDMGVWSFASHQGRRWLIERCASLAIIVTPGPLEVERARRTLAQLDEWHMTMPLHVVWVNRQPDDVLDSLLNDKLGRPVTSVIPYTPEAGLQESGRTNLLVWSHPNEPASQALRDLANRLAPE